MRNRAEHHRDGTPIEDVGRKPGISQATYYNWNK